MGSARILVVLLCGAAVAGCGGSRSPGERPTGHGAEVARTAGPAEETVTEVTADATQPARADGCAEERRAVDAPMASLQAACRRVAQLEAEADAWQSPEDTERAENDLESASATLYEVLDRWTQACEAELGREAMGPIWEEYDAIEAAVRAARGGRCAPEDRHANESPSRAPARPPSTDDESPSRAPARPPSTDDEWDPDSVFQHDGSI